MSQTEKKKAALKYLDANPLDYEGCAEIMGMSLLDFLEYRGMYLREFMEVEDRAFNRLEHLCMMQALGKPLPPEYENFDFTKARWILSCRRGWSTRAQQAPRQPEKRPEVNGTGKALVDKWLEKKIGDTDATGLKILSDHERRNPQ